VSIVDKRPSRGFLKIKQFLGHMAVRLTLSAMIVLSLVPHEGMIHNDRWFLLIFFPEFVVRALLAFRKESQGMRGGWRLPTLGESGLLLMDLIALVSFLPLGSAAARTTRWLRLFRLSRTIMLLRYWGPLLTDMRTVLFRRERLRQLVLLGLSVGVVSFGGTVMLNHLTDQVGADFDGDGMVGSKHDHRFSVRLWWAFRQIQDPGNMLASPHDAGTLLVSIFLTVMGLFLISVLIGLGTDVVSELMNVGRLRPVGMHGHTVVLNITPSTRRLLYELISESRKVLPEGLIPFTPRWGRALLENAARKRAFVIVGGQAEPPDFMREPELTGLNYRQDSEDDDEVFLDRADVLSAGRIVLFADGESERPDHFTIRTLLTIVERMREEGAGNSGARKKLIAEILDESNVGTAHKAIARASESLDVRIVPTERLLAQFIASVARRPGIAGALIEMLTSSGHELYSYRYGEEGNPAAPAAGNDAGQIMHNLAARGLARPVERRVLPVGLLLARAGEGGREEIRVSLNPASSNAAMEPDEHFTGFIALAPNMQIANAFAEEARSQAAVPSLPKIAGRVPSYQPAKPTRLHRVVIFGYRPATVELIESLVRAQPSVEILVMLDDEDARCGAMDDFDAHGSMLFRSRRKNFHGRFVPEGDALKYEPADGDGAQVAGRVCFVAADWTSSRMLCQLPFGFGSIPEVDLVLMISSEKSGSDARISSALIKVERLREQAIEAGWSTREQRVVAEVLNLELAKRLTRRYRDMGRGDDVRVFSIQELRAYFMFQSTVVDRFDRIYGELMDPAGQSFQELDVTQTGEGRCSFAELAATRSSLGEILVGVEFRAANGELRSFVGRGDPDAEDQIHLSQLTRIWVIKADHTDEASASMQASMVIPEAAPEDPQAGSPQEATPELVAPVASSASSSAIPPTPPLPPTPGKPR
jgi:hypothetical protein